MTAHDFRQLLESNPPPQTFVRRVLELLQDQTRELALLAIGEWEQLGLKDDGELLPALASMESPTWGTWNGLLIAISRARDQVVASGSAVERARLEQASGLTKILAFWNGEIPTVGTASGAKRFSTHINHALELFSQLTYGNEPDASWWRDAVAMLKPLAQYLATDPLAEIRAQVPRRQPWFLEEQGKTWSYSGRAPDFSASYVAQDGTLRPAGGPSAGLVSSMERLLGVPHEQALRRLLRRHAPEEIRGVLLGDFLVGRPVGEGGFGTVHVGRQLSTGRKVAIKLLHDGMPDDIKARFVREAGYLARFNHPHIVSVHAQGEERWSVSPLVDLSGESWFAKFSRSSATKTYIAMEWVEGQTVEAVFRNARLDPAHRPEIGETTEWFAQSAGALAAVHAAGLIHRDVKPGNLMLTADRSIKLMDFGIARTTEFLDTQMTTQGRVFGTLMYMSPEQIRAADMESQVGKATDIYSLCATFYELFTLSRLFDHDTQSAESVKTMKLTGSPPTPPRKQVRDLPWEIETILLGGLEADVADRYPTMEALERDLRHFLQDEPIEYRRPSARRRMQLAYRRNRAVFNVVAASLAAAVLGTALYIHSIRAEQARTLAQKELVERHLAENYVERARQELLDHKPLRSLVLASEAYRLGDQSAALRFILARGIDAVKAEAQGANFSEPVYSAAFDAAGDRLVTAGINGDWAVRDAATGKRLNPMPAATGEKPKELNSAIFAPDGKHVITTSDDWHIRVLNIDTRELLWEKAHKGKTYGNSDMLRFKRIISASEDGTAILWNLETGEIVGKPIEIKGEGPSASLSRDGTLAVIASEKGFVVCNANDGSEVGNSPKESFNDARISPDNQYVVTAGKDGNVKLWTVRGLAVRTFEGKHSEPVRRVRFNADGTRIVSASYDGTARLWDNSGKLIRVLRHQAHATVFSAEFSPDGASIVTASADGTACIWSANADQTLATLRLGLRNVFSATIGPNGKLVAVAGQDGLCVWEVDLQKGTAPRVAWGINATAGALAETFVHPEDTRISAGQISRDGKRLATTDDLGNLYAWDLATKRAVTHQQLPEAARSPVTAIVFDNTGGVVFIGLENGRILQWKLSDNTLTELDARHAGKVWELAVSPDGRYLASAGADGTTNLCNIGSGKLEQALRPERDRPVGAVDVVSVEFSGDGSKLLTGSWDGIARIWHVSSSGTGKPVSLTHGGEYVNDARFSPDGSRVMTAGDSYARVWSSDGTPIQELPGIRLAHARWSPDGSKIVTGSKDGHITIWGRNEKGFDHIASFDGHARVVRCVAFSPDSTRLVSAGDDGQTIIWEASSGSMLFKIEGPVKALSVTAWNTDGSRILTAGHDSVARFWNTNLAELPGNEVDALVRQRIPWQLSNGHLVSKSLPR